MPRAELLEAIRRPVSAAWSSLLDVRAELLVGAALLSGWALVTVGVTRVTASTSVWPLSGGLLLLSVCGWKFLYAIVRDGLYSLTREERRHG